MSGDAVIGTVAAVWRYPVKSLRGEALDDSVPIGARGFSGDRRFALRDRHGQLGSGKTTRRFRRIDGLLGFAARYDGERVLLRFPDGREIAGDDPGLDAALAAALGVEVTLVEAGRVWHMDAAPVHLVTTASLRWLQAALPESAVDPRRFRPNLILDVAGTGLVEREWIGRVLQIGRELRLKIGWETERCVMITLPQAELGADAALSRHLAQVNGHCFGVYADVAVPGSVQAGAAVRLAG